WTPWFSLFGSRSGFDSIEECFEEYSKYIFAVETGLSSNPQMNWRLSELDKVSLISNSDAHSPAKIGREANVLDTNLNYFSIIEAIKSKDRNKFLYTIEFFPEEGKYHYDGHRLCNISFSPEETRKHKNICPVCKKPLTIGVLSRVEALADRPIDFNPVQSIPFKSLISLEGIIKESLGVKSATKEVINQYQKLISSFKNELEILLSTPRTDLEKVSLPEIVEGIIRVRDGKVLINPGYDGVFGKIKIFSQSERKNTSKQSALL
ncbi:MAG: endonuclease Q family protein, partial [Patescibacteria group bacterium]